MMREPAGDSATTSERIAEVALHCEHWYPKLGESLYSYLRNPSSTENYLDGVIREILSIPKIQNKRDLSKDVEYLDRNITALEGLIDSAAQEDEAMLEGLRQVREDIPKPITYPPTAWQPELDSDEERAIDDQWEHWEKVKTTCGPMKVYDKPLFAT